MNDHLALASPKSGWRPTGLNKQLRSSGCARPSWPKEAPQASRGSVTSHNQALLPRRPWPYPFVRKSQWCAETHKLHADLNGAHGEYTGSDDVEGRRRKQGKEQIPKRLLKAENHQTALIQQLKSTVERLSRQGPKLPRMVAPHTSTFAQAALSPSRVARGSVHAPVHPPVMTQKCTLTARGVMIPNADNRASAIVRPVTVRDRNNIVLTTQSSVLLDSTGPVHTNAAQAGYIGANNNSPAMFGDYSVTAGLGGDRVVESRINVIGVKLRYIGRKDAQSGTVWVYNSHTHDDVSNVSKSQCTAEGLARKWDVASSDEVEYTFLPGDATDYAMKSTYAPWTQPDAATFWDYSTGTVAGTSASICIQAYGMNSDATIEVTVTSHCEFSGPQFDASSTMLHVSSSEFHETLEMHSAVTMAHLAGDPRHAVDIATTHKIEGVAATAAQAAVSMGVPGAGVALAADKFLMGKKGTALTSAVGGFFSGKKR